MALVSVKNIIRGRGYNGTLLESKPLVQIHASSVFEEIKKNLPPSSVYEEIK